jgi:hypothetical protein
MTKGRSRKRHSSSRKSTDENDTFNQDKVKRLLLLQLDAQVPEEEDHKSVKK